jgi:hypothetical protein
VLIRDVRAPVPPGVRERLLAQPEPPARRQHEDLVRLVRKDTPPWPTHTVPLALTELSRGALAQARHIVEQTTPPRRALALAELAFHCAWRRHSQEAEDCLVEAEAQLETAQPDQRCQVHAWLAGAYHALGWPEQARCHLDLAHRSPEPSCDLLAVRICMDPSLVSSLPDRVDSDLLREIAWYCELETALAVWPILGGGFKSELRIATKLVREGRLDQLVKTCAVTGPQVAVLAFELAQPGPAMDDALARLLRELPPVPHASWFRCLELASRRLPSVALERLQQGCALQGLRLHDADEAMFLLGQAATRLGWWPGEGELETLGGLTRALRIGQASLLDAEPGEALLREEAVWIDRSDDLLWRQLTVASVQCGASDPWLQEVTSQHVERSGETSLVWVLAQAGAVPEACRLWRKLPPSEQRWAARDLLHAVCRTRDHDLLYDVLLSLGPGESWEALEVLQTLTGQGP